MKALQSSATAVDAERVKANSERKKVLSFIGKSVYSAPYYSDANG